MCETWYAFTAGTNKKYFPNEELVAQCRALAEETGATHTLTEDAMAGTKGADVIYTDVWVPWVSRMMYGQAVSRS